MHHLIKYQNQLKEVEGHIAFLEQQAAIQEYLKLKKLDQDIQTIVTLKLEKQVQYYIYLCEVRNQLKQYIESANEKYKRELDARVIVLANQYLIGTSNKEVLRQLRNMLERKDMEANTRRQIDKEKYRRMYMKNQMKVMHHRIG